jgi:TetR/AcrR family transcriptional regulator
MDAQGTSSIRRSRPGPEASRSIILKAASAEFADHGLAGARMDAIAAAAKVNKALLYYYFRSKDALYGAVLEEFFQRLYRRINRALDCDASASERILLYARAHFDSVAESRHYARLFQSEMMSAGRQGSPHLSHIVDEYMKPTSQRLTALVQEGIRSREFRPVDPGQFMPTMVSSIVWYFVVSPVLRRLRPGDPYSAEAISQRRAAVLEFIAAALFVDREAGLKLAARIANEASGPEIPSQATTLVRAGVRGRRK